MPRRSQPRHPRRPRPGRGVAIAIALGLAIGGSAAADDTLRVDADSLKATFVFKFAHFVEWPDSPRGSSNPASIELCVIGRSSFAASLSGIVGNRTARGRNLTVRHIDPGDSAGSCQILFVGAASGEHLPEVLHPVDGLPILTVGETDSFARQGGMISLREKGRRLALEVNLGAAERSGLKLSSHLLGLASVIGLPPREGE